MLDEVASPGLGLLFDTGNGIEYGYDAVDLLEPIAERVEHVHVKDAVATPAGARYVAPGSGDVDVAGCLTRLLAAGYAGAWSLEPHVDLRPHEGPGDVRRRPARRPLRRLRARARAARRRRRPARGAGVATPAGFHRRWSRRVTAPATQGREPIHVSARLHPADVELLLELLRTPTVAPSSSGTATRRRSCGTPSVRTRRRSEAVGMATVWHGAAQARDVDRDDVPLRVREAAARDPRFLADQPSLLLRLGEPRAWTR